MSSWWNDARIYHIFPMGFCGAPHTNDFSSPAEHRILKIIDWLDPIRRMGFDTILLGPVFESTSHGYDTVDFYHIDRRLGNNESFAGFAEEVHRRGMRLMLDGVFNHVGRDFWAFYDLRQKGAASDYVSWFDGVSFSSPGFGDDGFSYTGWEGHQELVQLALSNTEVKDHLFGAIRAMRERFGVDGLRLDVAYNLDEGFLRKLAGFCRSLDPDFTLLGEVIHGDYGRYLHSNGLDSVTNYECYKGIYSSHNDGNFFEIAWSLNRLFGEEGLCHGLPLFNFVDNHDVSRIASILKDRADLPTVYALLCTIPGVPSLYYGSEWESPGVKESGSDWNLRPPAEQIERSGSRLPELIRGLLSLRNGHPALCRGDYRQVHVASRQLAFVRNYGDDWVLILLNSADRSVPIPLKEVPLRELRDTLTGEIAGAQPELGPKSFRIFSTQGPEERV
ncbi:alpha-amylase family glycosyl hydrolase [Sediminispirochaeta smaragdinae]|uniref:Alpha amylase catalytic region n=1 Tax=Sediminispirochaeta smaragdinae (strain DSM 11293 / JCM 15392 / SEBR 4228) TaxID=573413 RepID=E1R896_SEDSS|nr:alpha-amylase family glycosyl hydrolase [Sediminispirochaeta smaragdinae]ADK79240.1 alpha amylase catalytic region [Sediminispirochaeta smaragdinae DSM 11293]